MPIEVGADDGTDVATDVAAMSDARKDLSVSRTALGELLPSACASFGEDASIIIYTTCEAAQACWQEARQQCHGYAFQTYEWLACWQQLLGQRQGWQVRIVVLRDGDGRIRLLLPLGIHRVAGLRRLDFLGGEITDYRAPLIAPDFPMAVFGSLWTALLSLLQVDLFRSRRMPATIEGVCNPFSLLPGIEANEQAHAATLPSTYAEFQKSRSAKMFADTRRRLRNLEAIGKVRVEIDAVGAQRAEVVATMARQKSRRWRETQARDIFREPGYLEFYQRLAEHGISGGSVVLSGLYVDEQLVATHWGLRYGERFYWLMPAYQDGDWTRYAVGRQLLDAVVKHSIATGLKIFDLTVGDESFKQQWADHTLMLYGGQHGVTRRGKFAVAVNQRWQQLYAGLRANSRLRNLVRRLRGRAPITAQ